MSYDGTNRNPKDVGRPLAARSMGEIVALDAPDLVAPVVAFRDFRLADEGLSSLRAGVVWRERTLRAVCLPQSVDDFARPPHESPEPDCGCGIHVRFASSDRAATVDWRGVPGIVTVWGRIMVGASGMRAEYARVEALGAYARWTRRQRDGVSSVAQELGVDIVDVRQLPEAAARYGSPLPPALIPRGDAGAPARALQAPAAAPEREIRVPA
jgi:hypothetical protein